MEQGGGGGGGWLQPLPWIFAVLQYLENIVHLIHNLSCHLQDKVNIIDCRAAEGSVTSTKMATKMVAILDFTKNSNLSGKLGNCK